MGGNIFKDCQRINRDEYRRISNEVSRVLEYAGRKILIPDSFKNKETHGDLDVIVEGAAMDSAKLVDLFNLQPDWISRNTSVISIYFEGKYQVDLAFHQQKTKIHREFLK